RGQIQGEGAARAGLALQLQLAAEELRELAADREPEPGAAVLAGRARVGLLKRLEYDLLLVERDADAGVDDLERDHALRAVEDRVPRRPAVPRRAHAEPDAPFGRELERVRQQVLHDLEQPLRVGIDRVVERRIDFGAEMQSARLGLVRERALERIAEVRERKFLAVDGDRARLYLR